MARRNLRRRASRLLAPLAVLLLAAGPATAAAQLSSREVADRGPRAWAITGGMVHVGDGTVLEGATVVIRDGLIVSVAAGGEVPAGLPEWMRPGSTSIRVSSLRSAISASAGFDGGSGPGATRRRRGRANAAASFAGARGPPGHLLLATRRRRPAGERRTDRGAPEHRVYLGGLGAAGRDRLGPGSFAEPGRPRRS